jgi:hypothetical protein
MKLGYGRSGKGLPFASKQMMVALGILVLPMGVCLEKAGSAPAVKAPEKPVPVATADSDPRTVRLKQFFASLHCPVSYLSAEFIRAADENGLDWRLLPSISVIESGGGKAYKNNNLFGWANGDYLFPTLKSGIHEVAFKLGKGRIYRNRDVLAKLHLYNKNEDYATNVMTVMNRISPVVHLEKVNVSKRQAGPGSYSSD